MQHPASRHRSAPLLLRLVLCTRGLGSPTHRHPAEGRQGDAFGQVPAMQQWPTLVTRPHTDLAWSTSLAMQWLVTVRHSRMCILRMVDKDNVGPTAFQLQERRINTRVQMRDPLCHGVHHHQ